MKNFIQFIVVIILFAGSEALLKETESTDIDYIQLIQSGQRSTIEDQCLAISDVMLKVTPLFKQLGEYASIPCQLHLQSIAADLKKVFDNYIMTNLQKYLKNIDGVRTALLEIQNQSSSIPKPNYSNLISTAIKNKDYCAAYSHLKSGQNNIHLKTIIHDVYNKSIKNVDKLLEFFNSFENSDEILYGYRLLLDVMRKNHQEYSTTTTVIGLQILNIYKYSNNKTDNYIYLRDILPESIKLLPWNSTVLIRNSYLSLDCLFSSGYKLDDNRRYGFTNPNCRSSDYSRFTLLPNTNMSYFQIINNEYDEYLIAESDEFSLDNERRRIVTIKKTDTVVETGKWQFEPIEESKYFKIKNLKWNEYLAVEKGYKYELDGNCRHMFTSRTGGCDHDGCKWKIDKF